MTERAADPHRPAGVHGADTVFCVPGESYLAALDALGTTRADTPDLVSPRGGCGQHGRGVRKLTGRPGDLLRHRGPGATHASVGVIRRTRTRRRSCSCGPGGARGHAGRGPFRSWTIGGVQGRRKWAAQIDDAARIPEHVARAFSVSDVGPSGPVALALPEDVLADVRRRRGCPLPTCAGAPGRDQDLASLGAAGHGGAAARDRRWRWLVRAGGRGHRVLLRGERTPEAASFRCQDYVDNRSSATSGFHLTMGRTRRSCSPGRGRRSDRRGRRRLGSRHHGLHAGRCRVRGRRSCTFIPIGRARSRLPDRPADRVGPDGVRDRCTAAGPVDDRAGAAWAKRPRGLPPHLGKAAPGSGPRSGGGRRRSSPSPPGRRRLHMRGGELHGLGAPLLRVLAAIRRSLRRGPGRWATGSRRRSRRRRCSRSGRSSASQGTATS